MACRVIGSPKSSILYGSRLLIAFLPGVQLPKNGDLSCPWPLEVWDRLNRSDATRPSRSLSGQQPTVRLVRLFTAKGSWGSRIVMQSARCLSLDSLSQQSSSSVAPFALCCGAFTKESSPNSNGFLSWGHWKGLVECSVRVALSASDLVA